jgi:hypothetical protein
VSYANIHAMMNGLKSYVQAQLPARLTQVETEIGTTITDLVDHVLGYREALSSDRYPVAFFVASSATPEDSAQHGEWFALEADIVIAYRHSTPAGLETALLGYADAVRNLVGADESLGGLCDVAEITYIDWYHGAPGAKDIGVVVVSIAMRIELRT